MVHNVLSVKSEYDRNLPDSEVLFMDSLLEDILTADHIKFLMLKALDVERTTLKNQGKESQERDHVDSMREVAAYRVDDFSKDFANRVKNPEALKMFLAYNVFLKSKGSSKHKPVVENGTDLLTMSSVSERLLSEVFMSPKDQHGYIKEAKYLAQLENQRIQRTGKLLSENDMNELRRSSEMGTFKETTSAVEGYMKVKELKVSQTVVDKIKEYVSSL